MRFYLFQAANDEVSLETLLECYQQADGQAITEFEWLIANVSASQREVLTMLKVSGLSLDQVARATSSTIGAVKQKARRAYAKLRTDPRLLAQTRMGNEGVSG